MDLLTFSIRYEWLYRCLATVLYLSSLLLVTVIEGWWICLPLIASIMLVAGAYRLSLARREYKKRRNYWYL